MTNTRSLALFIITKVTQFSYKSCKLHGVNVNGRMDPSGSVHRSEAPVSYWMSHEESETLAQEADLFMGMKETCCTQVFH